jgi:hypothetical protein
MNWVAVVWAGFVAITIATAFFWVFRSLGWTLFSPTVQTGGVFLRNPHSPATETLGFVLLFTLGSTLIPGAYAWLMAQWLGTGWQSGSFLGLLQGILVVGALPLLGMISASVRSGPLPAPGRLGLEWGRFTPVAIVLGHVLYGAIVGAMLAAF